MHFVAINMAPRQVGEASSLCFFARGHNEDALPTSPCRRPIFIATLRTGASWPLFCDPISIRMIQIETFTAESSGVAGRSAALFETKSCEHFVLNLGFISRPLNRRASAVGPVEIMEVKVYPADLCEMLGN
jgi:hypothetical protein